MRPCSNKQGPITCSLPRDPNPPGRRCPAAGPCSSGTSLSPPPVPSRRAPAPAAGPLWVDTFRRPPVTPRSLQKSNTFPVLIVLCPAGFSCSLKNTPINVGATFCLKFLWQVKDPSMPMQTIGLRKDCPPPPRRILPAISACQAPAQFSLFVTPEKMMLSPASQNYFCSTYTSTFHPFQGNLPQPALQKCSYSWCSQKGRMAKEMFRFFMD